MRRPDCRGWSGGRHRPRAVVLAALAGLLTSSLVAGVGPRPAGAASSRMPVTLTLQAPATAPAGHVVTLDLVLSPAPDGVVGLPSPTGTIAVYDDAASSPDQARIPMNPGNMTGLVVDEFSNGMLSTEIALAPGAHRLRAVFTPDIDAASSWEGAESAVVPHVVAGSRIPTSMAIEEDSTQGTRQVGTTGDSRRLYLVVRVAPEIAFSGGAPTGVVQFSLDGASPTTVRPDSYGRAVLDLPSSGAVGPKVIRATFDPSYSDGTTAKMGNQGFGVASVDFAYEVVPSGVGVRATGTRIAAINQSPARAGSGWGQFDAVVTSGAAGSVAFTARNVTSGIITPLGVAPVDLRPVFGMPGRAILANPPAAPELPAGDYAITAAFLPDDPLAWAPSTSAPRPLAVVAPGSPLASTIALTVLPAGRSLPGQPVILDALVEPAVAAQGWVEYFDGGTSVGAARGASNQLYLLAVAPGRHRYTAVFWPRSSVTVTGSTSNPVVHVVAPDAPVAFTDVPPGHAFFDEISWLGQTGITTGYVDGSFRPTGPVDRQAMAAFLYRLAGEPDGGDPVCSVAPFPDVAVDATFCGEIAWLAMRGITTGYTDGTFRPLEVVARQAMAAFLYRFSTVAAPA